MGGGQLADLEHFVAYTKDTETVYLKKHSYLIYKAGTMPTRGVGPTLLISNRCDLIKTLKIDGVEQDLKEMGKERTPHVFTATTENDKADEIIELITGDEKDRYVFEIIDPEAEKEYKVEIEWFDNITECISLFDSCKGLISIPSNLFATNTAVTNFSSTFYECSGLTSIPEDLFATNTAVTDFTYTFSGCINLLTMPKDNDGTPIYNRSEEGKEDYEIVTDCGYCFCNCYNIEGYELIPSEWNCLDS